MERVGLKRILATSAVVIALTVGTFGFTLVGDALSGLGRKVFPEGNRQPKVDRDFHLRIRQACTDHLLLCGPIKPPSTFQDNPVSSA